MREENEKEAAQGLSRKEEEKKLEEIIDVAQENLDRTRDYISNLSGDLKDLLEVYETKDKEALALWHNTESQLNQTRMDLLRCEKARKKPYFGWIQFKDPNMKEEESYYVGRVGIAKTGAEPVVIDWRAPVASVYYENVSGPCRYVVENDGAHTIDLKHKRTYEIALENTCKNLLPRKVYLSYYKIGKTINKGIYRFAKPNISVKIKG